jgi:hypothetical protein
VDVNVDEDVAAGSAPGAVLNTASAPAPAAATALPAAVSSAIAASPLSAEASSREPLHFRLVLAPTPTPASLAYTAWLSQRPRLEALLRPHGAPLPPPLPAPQVGEVREWSPASVTLAAAMAARLAARDRSSDGAHTSAPSASSGDGGAGRSGSGGGGCALIIDYGAEAVARPSVRGIREHAFVDMLSSPGRTDLSADVDFGTLRAAAASGGAGAVAVWGPVSQGQLLQRLGIVQRCAALAAGVRKAAAAAGGGAARHTAAEATVSRLEGEVARLVGDSDTGGMGAAFQAMALVAPPTTAPADAQSPAPVGFE